MREKERENRRTYRKIGRRGERQREREDRRTYRKIDNERGRTDVHTER